MLKILTIIAPFVLKGAAKNPAKSLAGQFGFYVLFLCGSLFLCCAIFIWLKKTYSFEVAFLGLGLLFMIGAAAIKFFQWQSRLRPKLAVSPLPNNIENDVLAANIPDSLKNDPMVKKVLGEISKKPLAASATALTIGMLLSREYFD